MTWHTVPSAPATPAQIAAAEAALGCPIPDLLKTFYARHDGLLTFLASHVAAGDPGEPSTHLFGVASENLRLGGLISVDDEDNEFIDYIREQHGPGVSPLAFETQEFSDWMGDIVEADGFPEGWLCIATNIQIHDTFWTPARPDATIVCQLPSPRFAVDADIRRALRDNRMPLEKWLRETLRGD
ncbi:MAG: hypothetical protein ACI8S6_003233 [Myxococcota bacterium]|jgi:hypothetical protein